jgi:hypothetical protein
MVESAAPRDAGDYGLDSTLADLRSKIINQAEALAKKEKAPLESRFVRAAVEMFAPGIPVPPPPKSHPVLQRLTTGITGITLIAAALTVVFGALALFKVDPANTNGFLDIAKLLAGAVVGSTGAAVAAGRA